jgi:4,5-dihydroxyphthalate decarboxylase
MSRVVPETSPATTPSFCIRGGDYEHLMGLPGERLGFRFTFEPMSPNDIFKVMLESRPFEVCEFSLANYITLRARGEDWVTALPIFPNRAFRHGTLITRRDSDLVSLAQLGGRRVAVDDYTMTAAVWVRGLLADEYGVDWRSITWVTGRNQRFAAPAGARIEFAEGTTEDLLLSGKADASVGFVVRDFQKPLHQRQLRTILRDAEATELAYYERTSIYPINHCVAVLTDVHQRHPGLLAAVAASYMDAKQQAYARRLGSTMLPWAKNTWSRVFDIFGGDPLPYGLTPVNRMVVAKLAGYLKDQGFIDQVPKVDSLFTVPDGVAFS